MKTVAKMTLGALLLMGAAVAVSAPASAGVGISFGWYGPGFAPFSDPCDYYDYYDEPPPWGLPPDYCDYPVYFGPVFWDGFWYRGPIYYRWYGGERLFWLHGGWHRDGWRGGPMPSVRWNDRGGPPRGFGPGRGPGSWHGRPGPGGDRFGPRPGGGNRIGPGPGWDGRGRSGPDGGGLVVPPSGRGGRFGPGPGRH